MRFEPNTYIFGYGSLLHPGSANVTLGRNAAPEPFPTAVLAGYARVWDYVTGRRRDGAAKDDPARAVALNVTPDPAAVCNGVLIAVSADELQRLDLRESGYDRIDVTSRITFDAAPPETGWSAYTYVGRAEKRVLPAGAFIPTRYDAVVREGAALYGPSFAARFAQTTRPHALPICDAFYPNDPAR
jgi:cation transport regulator ChaC